MVWPRGSGSTGSSDGLAEANAICESRNKRSQWTCLSRCRLGLLLELIDAVSYSQVSSQIRFSLVDGFIATECHTASWKKGVVESTVMMFMSQLQ